MVLVDAGPLISLFKPNDPQHEASQNTLGTIKTTMYTTIPVLTEVFHFIPSHSRVASDIRDFIYMRGIEIFYMNEAALMRSCELMEKYNDRPMGLADASLITAAEMLNTTSIFTLDLNDFNTYKIKKGFKYQHVDIVSAD